MRVLKVGEKAEAARVRTRIWTMENRARATANARRYQTQNKDRVNAASRAWSLANPVKKLLASVRCRARKKGQEFSLCEHDIEIPAFCPVLGIPLDKSSLDNCPSIDRVDNSVGYVVGNIVVVSLRANRLKSDARLVELQMIAKFYGSLSKAKKAITA